MQRITKQHGWWALRDVLLEGVEFTNSNKTFRGEKTSYVMSGRLSSNYAYMLLNGPADYVVYSYSTPIAWHVKDTNDWVVPDVKYSPTTSQHQSKALVAISQMVEALGGQLHR